jgi:hypothetical protein
MHAAGMGECEEMIIGAGVQKGLTAFYPAAVGRAGSSRPAESEF